ncbi:ATP-binding protein [uncultured Clostridium sp.]|uniref:sensor histidine kinase n=1 Tax=uncultured Clostridium sp. TaxID=59620 RepID=UPI0025D57F71|nr:ATP-binding protein [uncultured Clostridium sp.]
MKKKLNIQLILMTIVIIFFTLTLTVIEFYKLFEREVIENLKTISNVIIATDGSYETDNIIEFSKKDNVRITVVKADGIVEFDSLAEAGEMDNHKNRPEVLKAFEKGEGSSVRKSKTLEKSTFYYAVAIDNDTVLRIAKEAISIWNMLKQVCPSIGCLIVVIVVLCIISSNIITKNIIKPIGEIARDIDHCGSISVYKELTPFINTIKEQHEDILKSARMRQDFTANVSHELKTPLTSICGYAELIENGMTTEEDTKKFVGQINKNANRLLNLINDIIELSHLDSNNKKYALSKVDLYEIAKKCVDSLQINAKRNDVSIYIEGSPSIIMGNNQLLEELVYNLCDNAIRYNNKYGIVKVFVTNYNDKVVLRVKDNGIGISKDNQERIFERFYRVDKSRSKVKGGTGLGLAIVKHILAQHDAGIKVESELNKGSEFIVTFSKEN